MGILQLRYLSDLIGLTDGACATQLQALALRSEEPIFKEKGKVGCQCQITIEDEE